MSDNKNFQTKKVLPFAVRKQLQNLKSWKALYTYLGTPNPVMAAKTEEQIKAFKAKHNIEDED